MLIEMLPHLWITSYDYNYNSSFINKKKINIIINLSKLSKYIQSNNNDIIEIKIPINGISDYKELNTILLQYLHDTIPYIHANLLNHKKILIVGNNNGQDAESIIAAYLIKYAHISLDIAEQFIKSKRDQAFNPTNYYNIALSSFNNT